MAAFAERVGFLLVESVNWVLVVGAYEIKYFNHLYVYKLWKVWETLTLETVDGVETAGLFVVVYTTLFCPGVMVATGVTGSETRVFLFEPSSPRSFLLFRFRLLRMASVGGVSTIKNSWNWKLYRKFKNNS